MTMQTSAAHQATSKAGAARTKSRASTGRLARTRVAEGIARGLSVRQRRRTALHDAIGVRQLVLPLADEIIVDLFAGGGGMSTGIEQAIGRPVDVACNHNDDACSMHAVNHPQTKHYRASVFEVCARMASEGRPVGLLHLSPDCTHHSQAKGGQPRDRKIRALSWVGIRWAGQVRPRIVTLENVRQIAAWGPLVAKRDAATGRVVKLDGSVAAPGERVPVQEQFLVPDPKRAGQTWRRFVAILQGLGYAVEARILNAADYGAPTTRERLYMVARCDGAPIVWPEPTHHREPARGQQGWRSAAECIDWSVPTPSIFERERPLAAATQRRIAHGMRRFVLEAAQPFLLELANWSRVGLMAIDRPLRTITASPKGGAYALAVPSLVQVGYGERAGQAPRAMDIRQPLGTVVAGGVKHGLATAFLSQANGGYNTTIGRDMRQPMTTITNSGSQQQLVAAHLLHLRGNCDARSLAEPLRTISAGGEHHGVVEYRLSREAEAGALRCAEFLARHLDGDGAPARSRAELLELVTLWIDGEPWVVVDIALRMLTARELYTANGFPSDYRIDRGHDGRVFSKAAQVRMCGNAVSPYPACALVSANWHSQAPASAIGLAA